jgi:peptidoglycan/xylan/chitin deacetylase (PgdA/CDA1 family)
MNFRLKSKSTLKKMLLGSGAFRVAHCMMEPSLVILRYHSIQDNPGLYADSIGVDSIHSTAIFREQMQVVAERFNPVSMDEVLHFLCKGERIPKLSVAITFDDGYADNFEQAMPILNHFGIPATFYLTVGLIGTKGNPWFCRLRSMFARTRKIVWRDSSREWQLATPADREHAFAAATAQVSSLRAVEREQAVRGIEDELDVEPLPEVGLMLTWDQAHELVGQGHNVGSHTLSHPNVAHIEHDEMRTELVQSKHKLEQELKVSVRHFSYPHPALDPQWNETTLRISCEAGYGSAVTTASAPVRATDDPLLLPRTWAPRNKSEFLWHLQHTLVARSI